ncbi:PIN domain-containing protein [Galliscardovia ingluviei]|uniref:PIN domain-containing protein n=1 Tax=Galliscardovia ingluviei TaxID=1769422 RepID=A0A8J3EZA5_9BIFI|nr:PIN domain-containing protein [Galliscardovia ingluviei]GGI14221.1 PIN domain-containing protein [Galliscardovia ingluviei]
MAFSVFLDTCTLYGEVVCDILLRCAERKIFVPFWSEDVLLELERVLSDKIGDEKARKRVNVMREFFPASLVSDYENLIETMECSDEDKHVLAAASHSPANTIVTFNVKDFPLESTEKLNIEVVTPDNFLCDTLDLEPSVVINICFEALLGYKKYPQQPEELCAVLQRSGLPNFAREIYLPLKVRWEA